MIATTSPTDICYEDTNNTLKYANRAKNIRTRLVCNIRRSHSHSMVVMNNKSLSDNSGNICDDKNCRINGQNVNVVDSYRSNTDLYKNVVF